MTVFWGSGQFNPVDNTSTRINPIDLVRYASAERTVEQAESLADLIIQNTTRVGQYTDMWDKAEKFLLVSLILHAAATDKRFGYLGAIRWLLLKGSQKVYDVLSHSPSEIAASEFEGFVQNTSPNFRHGVIAGLLSRLNPWLTPQVIALTATTDFDIEELQNELFTFYLSAPSRRSDLKTLTALTFNFLLDIVLQGKFKHPLSLLLDEFTNFGYVNGMADALSIIRKTGISAVLGFQDYMQLEKVYERKDAEIIFSQPGTSIFFRPRKYKSAKSLSDALGMQTVKERQVLDTGKTHEFTTPRALMTPDELMSLDTDSVIVFTPNTKPVRLKKFSYVDYLVASQYEPPENKEHVIDELIQRGGKTDCHKKISSKQSSAEDNNINFDQDVICEREEDFIRTAPDPGDLFEV